MVNIAVIYGGKSKEREVSLRSGKGIIEALKGKGCNVKGIDFTSIDFISELNDIDIVYIALHGKYGEDGRIQGVLDIMDIPYVGSGVLASALAMDKSLSKKIFKLNGIRVAKDYLVNSKDNIKSILNYVAKEFGYPLVIKPNQEGSSISLSIVNNVEQLKEALENTFCSYDDLLIEEFIDGLEVTVAVLESENNVKTLPIIEIIPNRSKYYDYESKYAPGGSDHIIPARIDKATEDLLKKWSVIAFEKLGCESMARVDFIIPKDGTEPVILEVNTLPGMTETSLYPDAAKSIGLSYEDIVYKFVEITLEKVKNRKD